MNKEELLRIKNNYRDPEFIDVGMSYHLVLHGRTDGRFIASFPADIDNCNMEEISDSRSMLTNGYRFKEGLIFSIFDDYSRDNHIVRVSNGSIYIDNKLASDKSSLIVKDYGTKVRCVHFSNKIEFIVSRHNYEAEFVLYKEPYDYLINDDYDRVEFTARIDGNIVDEYRVGWYRKDHFNYTFPRGSYRLTIDSYLDQGVHVIYFGCDDYGCRIIYEKVNGKESFHTYDGKDLEHEFIIKNSSTKSARK